MWLLVGFINIPQNVKGETPTGIACLHCMHPNSAVQRAFIVEAMVESKIPRVSTNIIVDGTFGWDPKWLEALILRLTENQQLILNVYLMSGPSQRRYQDGFYKGFQQHISPASFNFIFNASMVVQEEYLNLVRRLIPFARLLNSRRGSVMRVFPCGLEDVCTDQSLNTAYKLFGQVWPSDINYFLGRNPSAGSKSIPLGTHKEIHGKSYSFKNANCIVSNDGIDVSYSTLRRIRTRAEKNKCEHIIWAAKRQGISNTRRTYKDPDLRTYEVPTAREYIELVNFLQGK